MPRWEYLHAVTDHVANGAERLVRWVNEEEIEDWEGGPPLINYLNSWGSDGWELVSLLETVQISIGSSRRRPGLMDALASQANRRVERLTNLTRMSAVLK